MGLIPLTGNVPSPKYHCVLEMVPAPGVEILWKLVGVPGHAGVNVNAACGTANVETLLTMVSLQPKEFVVIKVICFFFRQYLIF